MHQVHTANSTWTARATVPAATGIRILGRFLLIVVAAGAVVTFSPMEITSPVLLVYLGVCAISLILMHVTVGVFNLRRLTAPSVGYLTFLGIIAIPALFVYQDQIDPFRQTFLLAVESVLITFPLGVLAANLILRVRKYHVAEYYAAPVVPETTDKATRTAFVVLFLAALVLMTLHLLELETLPILYLIQHPGAWLELTMLREDALKLLNSPLAYAYFVLRGTLFPYLTMLAFLRCLQTRQIFWFVMALLTFSSAFFYAAVSIEKAPVVAILLLLFLALYMYQGGKVSKGVIVVTAVAFFLVPIAIVALTYGSGLNNALQAMLDRVFYVPAWVMYYYFEVIPGIVPFQHGATIGKLAALMGWKVVNVPNIVGIYILRTEARYIPSITANAGFVANLYTDFGMTGVVVGGALAGFILQVFQTVVMRRPKTTMNLVISAFLIWTFTKLATNPLPSTLLSEGALLIFALVWLHRILEAAFRRTNQVPRFEPAARTRLRPGTKDALALHRSGD